MDLIKTEWNKQDYNEFLEYLYTYQDLTYQKFHAKITFSKKIIGIKTPILKNISKEISKGNYQDFIKYITTNTYEEWLIFGLIITSSKQPFKTKIELFDRYLESIDNWALCDIACANFKDFKHNLNEGFEYIKKLIVSVSPWKVRAGVVLLLDYYIEEAYLDTIFQICNDLKREEYYIKMAVSWLISICYIKHPTKTKTFLIHNNLDNFTYNKAIQKIIESKRISESEKEILRKMKKD